MFGRVWNICPSYFLVAAIEYVDKSSCRGKRVIFFYSSEGYNPSQQGTQQQPGRHGGRGGSLGGHSASTPRKQEVNAKQGWTITPQGPIQWPISAREALPPEGFTAFPECHQLGTKFSDT